MIDSVFSQNGRHSRCLVLLKSLLYDSKVLPARVRLVRSGSNKLVLDTSLCCLNFRSQPGRFTYSVGNVSDGASKFKGRHDMVCQILAYLVEMFSCVEINMLFSVLDTGSCWTLGAVETTPNRCS